MPDIPVGSQVFDVVFHPTTSVVYTALLSGHVKAFAYDQQGASKPVFSLRPSKKPCRSISLNEAGTQLYAVGRAKSLSIIDTVTENLDIRTNAHDVAINRVKALMPWLLSTGDDEGVIKLWDPRTKAATQTYTHHFDYITDFLWLEDKKHLVTASGDGTLSVIDVRAKKSEPIAHSEDQEDELLSLAAIKGRCGYWSLPDSAGRDLQDILYSGHLVGSTKIVVGTQLGILSIFNRNKGWNDCVDRIPGHPLSVDALCALPNDFPHGNPASTVLTGSSDGYVRAVEIFPTKLLGVVADHGEWPVERIAIGSGTKTLTVHNDESSGSTLPGGDSKVGNLSSTSDDDEGGPSRWWVASVGHEEGLRLTDLEAFFREARDQKKGALGVATGDEDSDVDSEEEEDKSDTDGDASVGDDADPVDSKTAPHDDEEDDADSDSDSDSVEPTPPKKRKEQPTKISSIAKKSKNKSDLVDKTFFDDL